MPAPVVRPGGEWTAERVRVELLDERIEWRPAGAAEPLVVDLPALFREALDD